MNRNLWWPFIVLFLIQFWFSNSVIQLHQASNPALNFSETFSEIKCGDNFPFKCQESKYRSSDGSCNNKLNPAWGMPYTRFSRLLPSNYANGINAPRVAKSGNPLPSARILSFVFSPDERIFDNQFTLAAMQFGQFIAHDLTLTDFLPNKPENQCCSKNNQLLKDYMNSPNCYPITIPKNDPDFGKSGKQCLHDYIRSNTDINHRCVSRDGSAEKMNLITSFLDLSATYGSTNELTASLREKKGGRLLSEFRNNHEWETRSENKFEECKTNAKICYKSGDLRVNQTPNLTIMHQIWHREHNRVAKLLEKLNPQWSDEKIFQEARKIVIAEYQNIVYYEWLPIFLGLENSYRMKIIYKTKNYVNDYNCCVNPSILNEAASAALRSFHTLVTGNLKLVNESRCPASLQLKLNDHFLDPEIIEKDDNSDFLLRGLFSQPFEASDTFYSKEITVFLDRGNNSVGFDLRAIDIQRGRDHGIPSYNKYRRHCGLAEAKTWDDFLDLISQEDVRKLKEHYECPDDIDLTIGAHLEKKAPVTLLSPTFHCIIGKQFLRTRVGDRFFFENGNTGSSFTIEQLNEIRKSSISRIICDNSLVHSMQRKGFQQISKKNPLLNCKLIPAINLGLWKEM